VVQLSPVSYAPWRTNNAIFALTEADLQSYIYDFAAQTILKLHGYFYLQFENQILAGPGFGLPGGIGKQIFS